MERNYLPVSIDITGARILVLGGDEQAFKKIQILRRFGAAVEVVSRRIEDSILKLEIPYKLKQYESIDLDGCLLVYSCLNNHETDLQVLADATARGILCNIHDRPELCRFISPAVYQNRNMTVAVASNGLNVHNSIQLRDHLATYLNEHIQKIIDL
ncbi:MAG: bifunctional precorrin-2 dehydrogenase/sirohydrochlorin ferrochelatase [Prolixibacteraceae bacterium]|nr:bifunctional precorrin-2 dehydrogenase/sirohydrochlorin ferrochelatase [Prolixibacteraceae bacterium]